MPKCSLHIPRFVDAFQTAEMDHRPFDLPGEVSNRFQEISADRTVEISEMESADFSVFSRE